MVVTGVFVVSDHQKNSLKCEEAPERNYGGNVSTPEDESSLSPQADCMSVHVQYSQRVLAQICFLLFGF